MRKLWIDCDPGVDDAVAILLASKMDFDIVGISTVGGNSAHDYTFKNARNIVNLTGKEIPVYPGAEKPMIRELTTAPYIHGIDGLGGAELAESKAEIETKPAWDAIYAAAKEHGEELEFVFIGPLTNLGIAITKYPELVDLIKNITIMGGSSTMGNIKPAAEFNIYVDPEAADKVFASGLQIVMFGLESTLQAYLTPQDLDDIGQMGSVQGRFLHDALQLSWDFCKKVGLKGAPIHDACAIVYLENKKLFTFDRAWVRVETKGDITRGKTVTDIFSDKKMEPKNVQVANYVDRDGFVEIVKTTLRKY